MKDLEAFLQNSLQRNPFEETFNKNSVRTEAVLDFYAGGGSDTHRSLGIAYSQ